MTIRINGVIVDNDDKWIYDLFGIDAFCPNDLYTALESEEGDLEVEINSGGGYVFAGSEIYTALMRHEGKVTVTITGLCASMASVIAMAGTFVRMSPTSQMMIHNVSSWTEGDYRDMEHMAEQLKIANETISNAYELKTGKTKGEILQMMDHETWLSPDKALEEGFIDEILNRSGSEDQGLKLVAGYQVNLIPENVIRKYQQEKAMEEIKILELEGVK